MALATSAPDASGRPVSATRDVHVQESICRVQESLQGFRDALEAHHAAKRRINAKRRRIQQQLRSLRPKPGQPLPHTGGETSEGGKKAKAQRSEPPDARQHDPWSAVASAIEGHDLPQRLSQPTGADAVSSTGQGHDVPQAPSQPGAEGSQAEDGKATERGAPQVTIVSARGLRDADWMPGTGASDPYCICEIAGKPNSKFQTLAVENTLNPVWNRQEDVEDYVVGDSLLFTVLDQDLGKKADVLGRATLATERFLPGGFEGELPLEGAGKGVQAFLKVRVTWSGQQVPACAEAPQSVVPDTQSVARRVTSSIISTASRRSLMLQGSEAEELAQQLCPQESQKAEAPQLVMPEGALERPAIGITGVGRLLGDSPEGKGTQRRRSIEQLGGELALRELIADFVAREGKVPELTRDSIQELWVDKIAGSDARVGVVYARGSHSSPPNDCRQFCLSEADGRWRVDRMLEPEVVGSQPDECEVSQAVDIPSPVAGDAKPLIESQESPVVSIAEARTPRRRAPPPLTELPPEEAAAAVDAADGEADADGAGSLAEAVRFGMGVAERTKTPRQLFMTFASVDGAGTPKVIHHQNFASLVSMYGGRSPAAHGGEGLSDELFRELAVGGPGSDRGVPYDLFCAEFCPEKAPDAVLRVQGKRVALLKGLQTAAAGGTGEGTLSDKTSGLLELIGGDGWPMEDTDFERVVGRLLGSEATIDPVAVKALWCELVRGKRGGGRKLEPRELCKVLLEAENSPRTPAATESRLSPGGGRRSPPSMLDASLVMEDVGGMVVEAPPQGASTLVEALEFGLAADGRAPSELFAAAGAGASGSAPQPLTHDEFVKLVARLAGGVPLESGSSSSSTDAEAKALFQELAVPGINGSGLPVVPYEIFAAEVCPDKACDGTAKCAKLRAGLWRELKGAVRDTPRQPQVRWPAPLAGTEPLDEEAFRRSVHALLGSPPAAPPNAVAVKALWCHLVRTRGLPERRLGPKELLLSLTSATSPSGKGGRNVGALEVSDDETSELELSLSQSVPGPDAVIDDVTPFTTPTTVRALKASIDSHAAAAAARDFAEPGVFPARDDAGGVPTIQVVPPPHRGPAGGPLAETLLEVAKQAGSSPKLQVTIVSASGLRDADWLPGSGTSDAYCVCEIKGKPSSQFQTLVVQNNLDPVWNRTEEMVDYAVGDALDFVVYDQDPGKMNDVLGRARLATEQFHPHGFEGELPLADAGKGTKASLKVKVSAACSAASNAANRPPASPASAAPADAAPAEGSADDEAAAAEGAPRDLWTPLANWGIGGTLDIAKLKAAKAAVKEGVEEEPKEATEEAADKPDLWGAVARFGGGLDVSKLKAAKAVLAQEAADEEAKEAAEEASKKGAATDLRGTVAGGPKQSSFDGLSAVMSQAKQLQAAAEELEPKHEEPAAVVKPPQPSSPVAAPEPEKDRFFQLPSESQQTSPPSLPEHIVRAQPGDPILGDYDSQGIRARSEARMSKKVAKDKEEQERLVQARSVLAESARDGRLAEVVAERAASSLPTTPSHKRDEERPGRGVMSARPLELTEPVLSPRASLELSRVLSPASASCVESTATPLDDSIGRLMHFDSAELQAGGSSQPSPSLPVATTEAAEATAATESLTSPTDIARTSERALAHAHEAEGAEVHAQVSPTEAHRRIMTKRVDSRRLSAEREHEVKLYQVRKIKSELVEREVPVARSSLNQGDCFVLDTEHKVYVWQGDKSQHLERYQATTLGERLVNQRSSHGLVVAMDPDAGFWEVLGGEGPVKGADEVTDLPPGSPDASKASAAAPQGPPAEQPVPAKKKLVGKSPLMGTRELDRAFAEADTNGDGVLSLEELLDYLGGFLGYGHAEIVAFHAAHSAGGVVTSEAFKRHRLELDPYNVHEMSSRLVVRKPGAFGGMKGVDFHIDRCIGSTVLICDRVEEVSADELKDCRVLVGPCTSSTFVRDCENCDFWVVTKQFRVRDCKNCRFYLHSHTEPVIELSSALRFAPISVEYPGLTEHFRDAGFDAERNFWSAVFDFTGRADTANWQFQPLDECETLVVTFSDDPRPPDTPFPRLSQELLTAPPPPSDDTGNAMANIPQVRPPQPGPPHRHHPVTHEPLGAPRRRLVNDLDNTLREGQEEIRGVAEPWRPLGHEPRAPPSSRLGHEPVKTTRTGRSMRRDDSSDDSDDSEPRRPMSHMANLALRSLYSRGGVDKKPNRGSDSD